MDAKDAKDDWDSRLQSLLGFSDAFLRLAQLKGMLSDASLKTLTRGFWTYHLVLAVVMTINVPRPIISDSMLFLAGLPLMLFWGVYVGHYFLVNLPAHMFSDLYMFFRHRDMEPARAFALAILVLVAALGAATFEFWIS
jgi:hypothetical protein